MNLIKKFFILTLILLSTNTLLADDKISYIDIDYLLTKTLAGKSLLSALKKEENKKIDEFKLTDQKFKKEEAKILAKEKIISKDQLTQELRVLQEKFQEYKKNKFKEVETLKVKRSKNIMNFLNLINPIIEKYMSENSIYMLMDKKNVFIASKNYDITDNLIELIDNQIKTLDIK